MTTTQPSPGMTTRFGSAALGAPEPRVEPPSSMPPNEEKTHRWRRRLVLSIATVALVVIAVCGGHWWGAHGRTQVWQVTRDLPAGAVLTATDVQSVSTDHRAALVAIKSRHAVVGEVTAHSMRRGQLLTDDLLPPGTPTLGKSQSLVGIAVANGMAPGGLHPGDTVKVFELPPTPQPGTDADRTVSPATILLDATVYSIDTETGNGVALTLVVPDDTAAQLTALMSRQRLALTAVR